MSDEQTTVQDQIDALRARIDGIDEDMVRMLNERASLALAIRELKPQAKMSLYDPKREEEIFVKLAEVNEGPLFDDNLREVWGAILHVMKEL